MSKTVLIRLLLTPCLPACMVAREVVARGHVIIAGLPGYPPIMWRGGDCIAD